MISSERRAVLLVRVYFEYFFFAFKEVGVQMGCVLWTSKERFTECEK